MSRRLGLRNAPLLQHLSSAPTRGWLDRLVFHGARVLLLAALAVLITALFPPVPGVELDRYEVGMVAPQDIIAQFAFSVPKSPQELELDRVEAAAAVPPTFDYDAAAADSMTASLARFFDRLDVVQIEEEQPEPSVREMLASVGIPAGPAQLAILTDSVRRQALRRTAMNSVDDLIPAGVIEAWNPRFSRIERFKVREEGKDDRYIVTEDIITPADFYRAAVQRLPPRLAFSDAEQLLRLILIRYIRPSYVVNEDVTEAERDQAKLSVPVMKASIMQGEAIVRANQQIGVTEIERLGAYREQRRNLGVVDEGTLALGEALGTVLFHALMLGLLGLVIYFFRPPIYRDFRWTLVAGGLIAVYFVIAYFVGEQDLPAEVLPVAFVSLSAAVLWDGRIALTMAAVLAVLTGSLPAFSGYPALVITLVAGAVAAMSVRVVRRRSQTLQFAAIISLAYIVGVGVWGLAHGQDSSEMFFRMLLGVGSATASAFFAMALLPPVEWFTGITTDQTLLEWADPNRSLLGRLSREASGTYAHTISVANLAESAATAIGANGLLCRVGSYYHDVGKMLKPQYFIENQPGGRNPHDRLKPEMSAAIVREHVVEGLRMAQEAGVPDVICDFIAQHHGTQKIGFFYDSAVTSSGGTEVASEPFLYPGPRPQSRETAILMVADSLESATRALHDPTRERIRELVETIVEAKIQEGQLDEAPLTLRDIAVLKEQFVKVLAGMYHTRIDYPSTKHLTEAPKAAASL